ncbi:ECU07_1523 [Encephalitozoon cuniculi GB-M1]|uniref:ECU07_1523 protein n=1 Tax=Encephalitozoon cuniculi (strain GB-M1) TaxID=284813 RepID=A0A1T5PD09_ENCCU|nr:uncharacterized protein ECU07_1523 [Encephalitozoon cuniculi GB-M1]SKD10689.1 ECU07_1523 [Encephalitozoon cuniculi GB-M1]
MTDANRTINVLDFASAVHNILKKRERLFGANKTILFTLFSSALVMIFQGENYKNLCLSIIVGLCMLAVDPKVHVRLLGTSLGQRGLRSAAVSLLNKIFLSELLFCILCLLIAITANMCVVPMVWIFAVSIGISFLRKVFTEDLAMTSMGDILLHLGFLLLLIFSLQNPKKSKIVVYSVFFSFSGSVILWIVLEAILNENLGFSRVCNAFFKSGLVDFLGMPQLYPFMLLMVAGVFSQIRINTLLFADGKRRFGSIIIKRSENKVIEV